MGCLGVLPVYEGEIVLEGGNGDCSDFCRKYIDRICGFCCGRDPFLGRCFGVDCGSSSTPAFVSASKLCEPLVAAVFAGILFDEQPSWLQVLGGILILGGVFYYSILVKHKNDE